LDRYSILRNDRLKDKEQKLKDERANKKNWYYFDHVEKMCDFMLKNSPMWIPIKMSAERMRFRALAFDNNKSAIIYKKDYDKTKHLLPEYLKDQFKHIEVIVFK